MKNNRKHLQYERLRSCHNVWAWPLIMSSLSTESALNWGFIRIEEAAIDILFWVIQVAMSPMLVELFLHHI